MALSLRHPFWSLWSLLPWSTFPAPPSPQQCQHTPDNTAGRSGTQTSSPSPIAWQPVLSDLDKCLLRERRGLSSPDPSDKPTMFLAGLGFADECFSPRSLHHTQSQHLKCCFPGENNCQGKGEKQMVQEGWSFGCSWLLPWSTGDVLKPACTSFPQAIFT